MRKALVAMAVVALASPAFAATVVLDDMNGPSHAANAPQAGTIDSDWLAVGWTADAYWTMPAGITGPDGSACQQWTLPNTPNTRGSDSSVQLFNSNYATGFPEAVPLAQWVQDAGGQAPADGPGQITMDIRVDVTGDINELPRLKFDVVFAGGALAKDLGGNDYTGDATENFFVINDIAGGAPENASAGVWYDDWTIVSWTDLFPAEMLFHPNMIWTHDASNPYAQGVQIDMYIDDIKIQYTPEPAAMSLFAIGGLALLRRRR
jgi:hypothetical protein